MARVDLVLERDHRLAHGRVQRGVERGVAGGRVERVVGVGRPAGLGLGQQPIDVALRASLGHLDVQRDLGHLALGRRLALPDHRNRREDPLSAIDLHLDADRPVAADGEPAGTLERSLQLLAQLLGRLADLGLAGEPGLADGDLAHRQRALGRRRFARKEESEEDDSAHRKPMLRVRDALVKGAIRPSVRWVGNPAPMRDCRFRPAAAAARARGRPPRSAPAAA